jgi:hypothetical protein
LIIEMPGDPEDATAAMVGAANENGSLFQEQHPVEGRIVLRLEVVLINAADNMPSGGVPPIPPADVARCWKFLVHERLHAMSAQIRDDQAHVPARASSD